MFLESQKFEVLEAGDGSEAVNLAKMEQPDMILMDLQLPVMSGIEATRRIRSIAPLADTPIVAITGFATEFDEARARATGCNEFIAKPYDMDHLLETINRLLDGKGGNKS